MNIEKHLFVLYLDKSHKRHVSLTRIWGILETDGIQFISFKIAALYILFLVKVNCFSVKVNSFLVKIFVCVLYSRIPSAELSCEVAQSHKFVSDLSILHAKLLQMTLRYYNFQIFPAH